MPTSSKTKELIALVDGQMGKGTLTLASDKYYQVTYLPTGIPPIDDLLQGGLPFGRFVEIFGDYSTLKSYIGLCAIRECQKIGKLAALIDTEHAFDPKWAEEIGVDLDNLIYRQPPNGEKAIDMAETLIRGGVDLIIFDSVAAALPKAEEKLQLGGDKNVQPARLAQLMSLAMRKLTAANRKTSVLWINQTRVNVGVMFGSNESVPGGKSLPFYASYRISVRKAGKVQEDLEVYQMVDGKPTKKKIKQTVAQAIRCTVEKSKLNTPHREILFNFDFRTGQIDDWWYLATKAMDLGLINYSQGLWWVKSKTPKKHRGRAAFQTAVPLEHLQLMLAGKPLPLNKPAAPQKKQSSKNGARVVIRTRVPAKSSGTVRRKTNSSNVKIRRVVIKSKKK